MKYIQKKQIWLCMSALLGGTIISVFAAVLVVRNLGGLVGMFIEADANAAFDFVCIFEQTKNAQITPHWFSPLLLFGIYTFALWYFSPRTKHIILWIILFVLLLTVGFACSLMLMRVNDIRFCDLLAALLPVISKL